MKKKEINFSLSLQNLIPYFSTFPPAPAIVFNCTSSSTMILWDKKEIYNIKIQKKNDKTLETRASFSFHILLFTILYFYYLLSKIDVLLHVKIKNNSVINQ